MKKSLLAGLACAALFSVPAIGADIPTKAPIYRADPPGWTWTGCYVGANAGYGWGRDGLSSGGISEGTPSFRGWLAGGQIGCDYQMAALVLGIEGMYDFADLKGSTVDPANLNAISSTTYDRLATATVRLGYAFDRSLLYVKGGLAWERSQRNIIGTAPAFTQFTGNNSKQAAVIGVGWEYLIAPNWSVKVEYNHFRFGAINESIVQQPGGAVFLNNDRNFHLETVMLGLNYRFNFH